MDVIFWIFLGDEPTSSVGILFFPRGDCFWDHSLELTMQME